MAQNQLMKRLLDAGMAFTQMTQAKAESIVKELVAVGEVRVEEAQQHVASLLEKGRETSEALVSLVRSEVQRQLHSLGLKSGSLSPASTKAAAVDVPASAAAPAKAAVKKAAAPAKAVAKKAVAPAKVAVKKAVAPAKKAVAKTAASTGVRDAAGVRKVATKKAASARSVRQAKS